jgi:hypothetical protein
MKIQKGSTIICTLSMNSYLYVCSRNVTVRFEVLADIYTKIIRLWNVTKIPLIDRFHRKLCLITRQYIITFYNSDVERISYSLEFIRNINVCALRIMCEFIFAFTPTRHFKSSCPESSHHQQTHLWRHSIIFHQFMDHEGSLPCSQELSSCTYPEPDCSSPHHPI